MSRAPTRLPYPHTPVVSQLDDYHGVAVPDPYRWLEDAANPKRKAWIGAQNSLTARYLANIPARGQLRHRFRQLLQYPRYYEFTSRGQYLFFQRNSGLQNQLVLHCQRGLHGTPEGPVGSR